MTLYEFYIMVRENLGMGVFGLVCLLSLFEFSKVKINPWSWIGNLFNRELRTKIDEQAKQIKSLNNHIAEVDNKLTEVKKEVNETSAMSSRYRILRFEDEIRHKVLHTKEHYDQIIVDIDVYETFCKRNPDFRNNQAHTAISNIKRMYDIHNADNSFL